MDPVSALTRAGGVARWTQLVGLGVGRGTLLRACRDGNVCRSARGLYHLPGRATPEELAALGVRGQLSCANAAQLHGLDLLRRPDDVHVRVAVGSSPIAGRLVVHRWGVAEDTAVTPFEPTLADCAGCLDLPDAVAVLDSAVRAGRIEHTELIALSARWGQRARSAVELVDPASQSVLESVGRVLVVGAKIAPVRSQVRIARVGWVDLVVGTWLVVEWDGREFHGSAFHEDRRRDAELSRQGFVVVRFTHHDLLHRREWVINVVRETFDRGQTPFGPRG